MHSRACKIVHKRSTFTYTSVENACSSSDWKRNEDICLSLSPLQWNSLLPCPIHIHVHTSGRGEGAIYVEQTNTILIILMNTLSRSANEKELTESREIEASALLSILATIGEVMFTLTLISAVGYNVNDYYIDPNSMNFAWIKMNNIWSICIIF